MTKRKILVDLTTVTGFLRKCVLEEIRPKITEVASATSLSATYIIDLLAAALNSDYRDNQLELFCSQIIHLGNDEIAMYPPLKILSALSGSPIQVLLEHAGTRHGTQPLEEYIDFKWESRRKEWLIQLDNDLENSGLAQEIQRIYPPVNTNAGIPDEDMIQKIANLFDIPPGELRIHHV